MGSASPMGIASRGRSCMGRPHHDKYVVWKSDLRVDGKGKNNNNNKKNQ
jgi:hypothetical protein